MKKKAFIIIGIILLITIVGIALLVVNLKKGDNKENASNALKTSKYVNLRGIYVDKSDEKDHPDEALLYVLYTVKSDDINIQFYTYMANNPGSALTIKINNTNEYKDTLYTGERRKTFRDTKYENLNDGQKVLAGTSTKCVGMFRVAKNDLKEGGIIELTLTGTDSFKEVIEYKTDDVQYYENGEEILKAADPESYEEAKKISEEKLADIDENLKKQINTELQNNYFYWYISTIRQQIEFDGNTFKVTSIGYSSGGTFEIKNKVILLHYDTGVTNQLPYEFKDGSITLTGTPE